MKMLEQIKWVIKDQKIDSAIVRVRGELFVLNRGYSNYAYENFLENLDFEINENLYHIDGVIWFDSACGNKWAQWVNHGNRYECWEMYDYLNFENSLKEMKSDANFYNKINNENKDETNR